MFNRVFLIGRLTKDPELKSTQTGKMVCSFGLATNEGKDAVSFHQIQTWDKLAELCNQYLKKGSKCFVEGRINYSQSEKNGEKKFFTQIVATTVKFLDDAKQEPQQMNFPPVDDLPF